MSNRLTPKTLSLSQHLYGLLLCAYPSEFRREYGREMLQVFKDCYRAEARRNGFTGIIRLWAHTLFDLAQTAPRERLHNSSKGLNVMKAIRTLVIALVVYAIVIVVAGKLLVLGRPYLPFVVGTALDSLLTIGIAFNFMVLLLAKTKLLRPSKAVWAASAGVVLLLILFLLFIPAEARPGMIPMTALGLSLLFWVLAHGWWARKREAPSLS